MSDEQNNANVNNQAPSPAPAPTLKSNVEPAAPKKKKGCLVFFLVLLGAFILGIVIIALISFFMVMGVKSAVKPDLDNFFEKYNNNQADYICTELIPPSVEKSHCLETLKNMNDSLGKEKNYRLSILSGTVININSRNGETSKYIRTTGNFEKQKNVFLEFSIFVDKSGKQSINSFRYKIKYKDEI